MKDHELHERTARRSGAYSCALNTGGMALEWLIQRDIGGVPWWPLLASGLVGVAILGALVAARRRPDLRLGAAAFLLNAASVSVALWLSHPDDQASGQIWRPFEANRLGALTVALLSPGRAIGLLAIVGYVAAVLVQYHLLPHSARQQLPMEEPWATIVYGIFAVVLLNYRLRGLALARDVARRCAEAAALERLAQASLALRDLANTPLQTLGLSLAILRARQPALAPVLDRMERALHRLQALGHNLAKPGFALSVEAQSPDPGAVGETGSRGETGQVVGRP
jgi:hypothetical protein